MTILSLAFGVGVAFIGIGVGKLSFTHSNVVSAVIIIIGGVLCCFSAT